MKTGDSSPPLTSDMNKIINLDKRDKSSLESIREEAGLWISRLANGNPDEEQVRAFREWLNRSPLHRREFNELRFIWQDLDRLSARILAQERDESRRIAKWISLLYQTPYGRYVTGLCTLVVIIGLAIGLQWLNSGGQPGEISRMDYSTATGEIKQIDLPDGTAMHLDTRSRVLVEYNQGSRTLYLLHGQVQFEVIPDAIRPFIVHAGRHAVKVVGTAFSVYLREEGSMDVLVSDGRIQVLTYQEPVDPADVLDNRIVSRLDNHISNMMTFDKGHHAVFREEIEFVQRIDPEEVRKRLSWRNNILTFNGDKLEDVIRELARYTPKKFVILDEELKDMKIGESGLGIRVELAGKQTVYLTRKQ